MPALNCRRSRIPEDRPRRWPMSARVGSLDEGYSGLASGMTSGLIKGCIAVASLERLDDFNDPADRRKRSRVSSPAAGIWRPLARPAIVQRQA